MDFERITEMTCEHFQEQISELIDNELACEAEPACSAHTTFRALRYHRQAGGELKAHLLLQAKIRSRISPAMHVSAKG